jgi:hypothetical protein
MRGDVGRYGAEAPVTVTGTNGLGRGKNMSRGSGVELEKLGFLVLLSKYKGLGLVTVPVTRSCSPLYIHPF